MQNAEQLFASAREWDEAMMNLYGRPIDVKMPTKTQILLIRACKVENHEQRLLSVYRRFYCNNEHAKFYVTGLLTDIVEKFIPMSTSKMIQKLNPRQYFTQTDPDKYFDRVFEVLVSHIANTACDEIPGYIAPGKWRNAK